MRIYEVQDKFCTGKGFVSNIPIILHPYTNEMLHFPRVERHLAALIKMLWLNLCPHLTGHNNASIFENFIIYVKDSHLLN